MYVPLFELMEYAIYTTLLRQLVEFQQNLELPTTGNLPDVYVVRIIDPVVHIPNEVYVTEIEMTN